MENAFFRNLSRIPSQKNDLPKGALLFERDDPVRQFHRVLRGEVHLLRRQMDGAAFILQRAHAGDILAEASLTTPYFHCGAEVIEAALIETWPIRAVRGLIEAEPDAALGYAHHTAMQLRQARLRAEILSLRKVSDRLEAWLAWHGGGLPPKGQMNRLARDINVSPEALYRELATRRD